MGNKYHNYNDFDEFITDVEEEDYYEDSETIDNDDDVEDDNCEDEENIEEEFYEELEEVEYDEDYDEDNYYDEQTNEFEDEYEDVEVDECDNYGRQESIGDYPLSDFVDEYRKRMSYDDSNLYSERNIHTLYVIDDYDKSLRDWDYSKEAYNALVRSLPKKRLSYKEERDFINRIKAGDEEARKIFILHNVRSVIFIARRFQNRGLPLNDLVSEGIIGMINAIEQYDSSRGWSFFSIAKYYISNAILNAIHKYGEIIYLPRHARAKFKKVMSAAEKVFSQIPELDLSYDLRELSPYILDYFGDIFENKYNISFPYINELFRYPSYLEKTTISMDAVTNDINDFDTADYLLNSVLDERYSPGKIYEIDAECWQESFNIDILEILDEFNERDRKAIKSYFGIGCKELTCAEIGMKSDINLTGERIRQIVGKAVSKIKAKKSSRLKSYLDQ